MCSKCETNEGWIETAGGMKRCRCTKPVDITPRDPVLSAKDVEVFVEMLVNIPFLPAETGARLLIGEEIRSMCRDAGEALWLVTRMARLSYTRWPGLAELRRVYCAKLIPLDGVLDTGVSEVYPEGIPSERQNATLSLPAPRSAIISADHRLSGAVQDLARLKGMR